MKEYKFLRLAESNAPLAEELKAAASRVVDSGWYLNGPETEAFARELADYCGSPLPAVTCSNGLDAIRLMLRALIELGELSRGDEIIVPANTYIASILPILEFGLVPKLTEPEPADFNLSLRTALRNVGPRTRAVMLVHLYGNPCWDEEAARELRGRGILLLEDNAQAIGAMAPGEGLNGSRMTGALGDAAAFSFYPTKNLGALGDAGAVMSPRGDILEAVKALANYGSDRRYHNIYRGYNCRMDELQAAILRVKLRHLEEETERRISVARAYDAFIAHPDVARPRIFDDRRQVWHQYPVHATSRDALRKYLDSRGVQTDVHYATPPHLQPCMSVVAAGLRLPLTERLANEEISLPIANVSPADAIIISEIINEFK